MASSVEQQGDCIQEPEKVDDDLVGNKDENQTMTPIEETNMFRIPTEIRAHIFERLDAPSILQLRCTHPLLKSLVDHYIGVNVHMTEVVKKDQSEKDLKSQFEFFGRVALRNLLIGYLENPRWEHGKSSSKKAIKSFTAYFDQLFLHPEFLKNIHLDGPIHVYYIRKFFLCCRNLINLSASANATIVEGLIFLSLDNKNLTYEEATTHLHKIYMPKLRFLKLFVMDPSKTSFNITQTENSLSILRSLRSGCLSRIILQVWINPQYTFSSVCWILITFMKLHPTLDTVFICFLYDHSTSDTNLDAIEKFEEVKLYKELGNVSKTLKLEKFGVSSKSAHIKIWEGFINEQNNLNHLSLTFSANRSSNWEHLTHSSCRSLNQIFIRGEFWVPFDCFYLERCTNLDEICLHNTNENNAAPSSILKNVSYIPCRLKSLILFNMIVATEDLLYLLKKLDKLETLVLFKTGRGNGNGVDVNCLEQVFLIRSLMSVLIVRFVAVNRNDAKRIMDMMDMQGDIHRNSPTIEIEEAETDWESEDTDETDTENSSNDDYNTETTEEPNSGSELSIDINNLSGGSSVGSMMDDMEGVDRTCQVYRNKYIFDESPERSISSSRSILDLSYSIQNLFISETHHSLESDTDGHLEDNISNHTAINYYSTDNESIDDELSQDYFSDALLNDFEVLFPGQLHSEAFLRRGNASNNDQINAPDDDIDEINIPSQNVREENTSNQNIQEENTSNQNLQEENTSNQNIQAENPSNDDFRENNTSNKDIHEENSLHEYFQEDNSANIDDNFAEDNIGVGVLFLSEGDIDDGLSGFNIDNDDSPENDNIVLENINDDVLGEVNNDDVDIEEADNIAQNMIQGMNLHLHMDVFNANEPEEDFFDIDDGENNIAAINVNPDGDDLQLVFEGDIDIEDIDLQEIIQVPEVQVHFVLDTILDVLSSNVRHSHWCRSEDVYGNVVFTLKLCMKTDY